MELSGYIDISDSSYNEALMLGFSDYITNSDINRNKDAITECLKERLADECSDFYLDKKGEIQVLSDLKEIITQLISII